jgi:BON domain
MHSRVSRHLSVVVFLAALVIAVGCSKAPSDAQIATDIQTKINGDSGLQGKQLGVQAANGVVTLSGAVDSEAQREAAARYASTEPGVKEVVNNLQVAPAASAQTAMATSPRSQESKRRHESRKPQDDAASSSADIAPSPAPAPAPAPATAVPATPPPPPPPQKVTIPSGTALAVRLVDPLDSEKNQLGDTFHATLNNPITVNGDVVVPSGSDVQGHVVDVKSAGKFAGASVLVLQLDSIGSGGNTYNIQTDQFKKQGSSRGKNTAEKVGGGAAIGAIIGALAGGGKGAAIGAAAGGGLGAGAQAVTKAQQIKLPSETVLNFSLQAPVTVVATTQGPNSQRQRLDTNQ